MYLKELEITGFKSFAKKSTLKFSSSISAIVGPNGSGKSNIAEAFRFVLGEQSFKSMRGKRGEDLIFSGTPSSPKMGRASVKLIFDNSKKTLPIDFEEVILERVVYRDGVNDYLINGSPVRLKDVIELLASANIGSSGHHIISQGEADRILNTSPKERKAMLEDALGLKIFQYKKTESERKLIKTEENIAQVESLRKEIAPHIKFLKKQVEKIEEGKKMRAELFEFYRDYLAREDSYLIAEKARLESGVATPKARLVEIESEISTAETISQNETQNVIVEEIKKIENAIGEITSRKEILLKDEGRIEGQILSLENLIQRAKVTDESVSVSRSELKQLRDQIEEIKNISRVASNSGDIETLHSQIEKITELLSHFFENKVSDDDAGAELKNQIKVAQESLEKIKSDIVFIKNEEDLLRNKLVELRSQLEADKSETIEAEKKIIKLMSEKNEIQQELSKFAVAQDNLSRDELAFKQELTEAVVLVGREVLDYKELKSNSNQSEESIAKEVTEKSQNETTIKNISDSPKISEPRIQQIERRKKLERMKIRIEEYGISSGDEIIKEYKEVTERDNFLIREIEDLQKSSADLKQLVNDLGEKINTKFKEGILKINNEFQKFFELMFGGGTASICVVKTQPRRRRDTDTMIINSYSGDIPEIPEDADAPEEPEEGIEIKVNLPRKKISSLMMLSGGERALSSIALLFAISQVNPPPFIILDETDAALDEANSRKYGDMVENLAKNSQLILITHNRETMSRAGILYGVTMSSGVSQLLSVQFDDGAQWAK